LILRDLELSDGRWLVSAHSKGFSEMGTRETGEACVYPSGIIRETEIKSREKLLSQVGRYIPDLGIRASWLAMHSQR